MRAGRPDAVRMLPAVAPSSGPERVYAIACAKTGVKLREFTAAADDERSADENAVAELVEFSRDLGRRCHVYLMTDAGPVPLAEAHDGVGYLLASQDAVAADSTHGTQVDDDGLDWVREGSRRRHHLDRPTMWGEADELLPSRPRMVA